MSRAPAGNNSGFTGSSICEVSDNFSAGLWGPQDYLEHCLGQIKAKNPAINAVLDVYEAESRIAASQSQKRYQSGRPLSKLDGIPIGVKANIAVKGQVCHGGIRAYGSYAAPEDAAAVKNLRRAGAIILCSLNMEEGALGAATDNPWYGKTHNPLRPGFTPGGSSGGSAAAVAADMMPAALGTDTMGSVRIPSAYCGIVGYKPSRGLIPMDGVMPLSPTLDIAGPHVRYIKDAALLLPVMAGQSKSYAGVALSNFRFAAMQIAPDMEIEPEVRAGFERLLSRLQTQPSTIRADDVLGDYPFGAMRRAGLLVSEIEGAEYHLAQYEKSPEGFSDHFQNLLSWGVRQPLAKTAKAYAALNAAKQVADKIFETIDIILAPTAPQEAFRFGASIPAGQADFTAFANFAGLPAVSIPMGAGKTGLPIGLQIIGARGKDAYILQVATFLQEHLRNA